ncbi:MAG: E3 binding domain-containing protein, partial [Deltaproteobacteria bacterium]|nr:E3 binding domain-containing protein [Deltaproteobacteria bacterium]
MKLEIKIPSVGESVQEAVLVEWYKKDGDNIQKDEPLFVMETDKVTLEIVAEASGVLKILISEGQTVGIGAVVGTIDTEAAPAPPPEPAKEDKIPPAPPVEPEEPAVLVPEEAPMEPEPAHVRQILSPAVRRLVAERNIDVTAIAGTGPGNRVTKGDVLLYLEQTPQGAPRLKDVAVSGREISAKPTPSLAEDVTRKPMSPIRQRIASRLLEAKQKTAMLTTFNE